VEPGVGDRSDDGDVRVACRVHEPSMISPVRNTSLVVVDGGEESDLGIVLHGQRVSQRDVARAVRPASGDDGLPATVNPSTTTGF
jgi:hypothetical protein